MYFLKNKLDNVIILVEHEPSESMLESYSVVTEVEYQKYMRILELKKNLADTDYKAIKFVEGALSEQEYEHTREQRQFWRNEINRLEQELQSIA